MPPGSYTLCQGPLPGATRLRLAPGRRTKTVKALLQEARIPPWERPYLPQLWQGEQFLGWPGIALASFSTQGQGLEAQGWTFRWRPHRYPSPQTR
ncbi:MAG: tRNA lysidine(34) synthetase TilS [Pseudomonadales bacterium]|nr:tRNA lysidine(34) synthetase TilS [Pseudomonadales bacterium]